MRSSLIAALLVGLLACDDKPKDETPARPPVKEPTLDIDASVLSESIDPPAPAGDLKAEIDHFTNIETCISERQKLDPLVGDTISAIGYDTMFRDACRFLEAARDRKAETCDKIDASAVRQKCQSWVAMIVNQPDLCPLEFEGVTTHGRLPACVAIAARDPRLCSAELRTSQRATCEAMILKDVAKCSALRPVHKLACEREVTRWRDVLASPLEGLEKLPVPKETLALAGGDPDAGADAGTSSDVDLSLDVETGVVIVTRGDSMRIEIGSMLESESMHLVAPPTKRSRLGLLLAVERKAASVARLELVQANDAAYVYPPAQCDCKITNLKVEAKRGAPVSFTLDAKISAGTRTQAFKLDVTTWARDVVPDSLASVRGIPARLPGLPLAPAPSSRR